MTKPMYLTSPVYFCNIEKAIIIRIIVNHRADTIEYLNENFVHGGKPYRLYTKWKYVKDFSILDISIPVVHSTAKHQNAYVWLSKYLKSGTAKIIKSKNCKFIPKHDYTVSEFTYDKEKKTFISEASTLGISPGKLPRKYIKLYNPKTGNVETFVKSGYIYHDDEIKGWRYKSGDLYLTIFND